MESKEKNRLKKKLHEGFLSLQVPQTAASFVDNRYRNTSVCVDLLVRSVKASLHRKVIVSYCKSIPLIHFSLLLASTQVFFFTENGRLLTEAQTSGAAETQNLSILAHQSSDLVELWELQTGMLINSNKRTYLFKYKCCVRIGVLNTANDPL